MSNTSHELADQTSTSEMAAARRPLRLGVIALLLGLSALGLAVIPGLAYGRPLPHALAEEQQSHPGDPPAERHGGVTFRFRTWSVNFFGKAGEKKLAPPVEPSAELSRDPVHWFTISAIGCALLGIGVASFSQMRERHTVLTVCAIGCCAAAVTWQYFAAGIIVGVAAVIVILFLSLFGSALG